MAETNYQHSCGLGDESILESLLLEMVTENKAHESFAEPNLMENVSFVHRPSVKLHIDACPLSPSSGYSSGPEHSHKMLHSLSDRKPKSHKRQFEYPANDVHSVADIIANGSMSAKIELNSPQVKDELSSCRSRKRKDKHKQSSLQVTLQVSENDFVTSGSVIDPSVSEAISKRYYSETLLPAHLEDTEHSRSKSKKHKHKRSVAQNPCDYLDNGVECNMDLVQPATPFSACYTIAVPNCETNIAFQDPINKKEERGIKKKHRVKEKTISPTLVVATTIVTTSKLNEFESCSNSKTDYSETSFYKLVKDAELSELLKPKRHKHKHKRSVVQDISGNVVDCSVDSVHISARDTASKGEPDIPFHDPVSKEERRIKKKHCGLKEATISPTLDVDSRFAGSDSCEIRHDSISETVDVSQMSDYHVQDISRRKHKKKKKHRSAVHNIDGAVDVNTPDVTESYSGEVVQVDDSEVGNLSSCLNESNSQRKRKKSKKHKMEYYDAHANNAVSIDSKTEVVPARVSAVPRTAEIDSPSLPPEDAETVSKRKHKKGKNHKLDDCQESVDIEMLGLEAVSNNSFICHMEKLPEPDAHDLLSTTTATEFENDEVFSERKHKRHRKQKTDTFAADARLTAAEVDKVEDSSQDLSGTGKKFSSAAAIDASASFSENAETVSARKRKNKCRNVDVDPINEYVLPHDSVDRTRDRMSENNTGKKVSCRQSSKCKVKLNTVSVGSDDILNSISNSRNGCSVSLDVPSVSDQPVDAVSEECQRNTLLERKLKAVENGFLNISDGSNAPIIGSGIHDDLETVESTGNTVASQGYNRLLTSPALVTDQKMESVQMQRLGLGTEASFEHLLLTELVTCDPADNSEHQGIQNSARNRLGGRSLIVAEFTSSDSEDEAFQNINWNISHKYKSRAEGARLVANTVVESEVSFSAGLNFCIDARNHLASPRNNSVADFVKGYSSCSDVEPLTDKDDDSAARIRTSTQKTPVRSAVPVFELKNTGGIQGDGNSSLLIDNSGSCTVLNETTKSRKLVQDCADKSDGATGAGSQGSDRHAMPTVNGDCKADISEPLTVRVIMLSPARTRQKRKRSSETDAESLKSLNSRSARRGAAKNVADAKHSVVLDAGKKYKRRKLDLNDPTELPLETNAENTGCGVCIDAVPAQLPTGSNTEVAMSAASDADEDDVVMDSNSDSSSPENTSPHRRKWQKSLCGNVETESFPTPSSQVRQHSRNVVVSPDLFQSDCSASEENDVQREEENVADAEHSSGTKNLDTIQQKLLKQSRCLENSDFTPIKTLQPSSSIDCGKQEKVVTKVRKTPARVARPLQVRVGPSSVTRNTSASKNRSRQPTKAEPSAAKVPLPGGNSPTATLRSRSQSGDADTSYSSRSSRLSVLSDEDDDEFDEEWVTEENLERLHAENYRSYLRTRKQVQEAGLLRCCKFGHWSDYEFHCLKDNWNELIKDCPLPDPTVLLSRCSSLDKPTKLAVTRYVVTSEFYRRIARNIPRTIFAVCEKARRSPELFDSRILSKLVQYRLRVSHRKYGNNWQKIAASTGLSEQECREALNSNDDGDAASVDQHQPPRQQDEELQQQQQQQSPRQQDEGLQQQQQQQSPRQQDEELQQQQQQQQQLPRQQEPEHQQPRQKKQQQQSDYALGKWTEEEITSLRNAVKLYIKKSDDVSNVFSLPWAKIAVHIPTRSRKQCRNKWLRLSNDGPAEFPLAEKMRAIEEILASQAMDDKEFDWNSLWSKFNYLPSPQFLRDSVLRLKRVHIPRRRHCLPWRDGMEYLLQVTFPKLDRHHTFTQKKSRDSTGKTTPGWSDKSSVEGSDSSRKARSSSSKTQPSFSSQEPIAGCSRAVSDLPQDTFSSPQTTPRNLRSRSVRAEIAQ